MNNVQERKKTVAERVRVYESKKIQVLQNERKSHNNINNNNNNDYKTLKSIRDIVYY